MIGSENASPVIWSPISKPYPMNFRVTALPVYRYLRDQYRRNRSGFADWHSQGILRQRQLMGGDDLCTPPLKVILDEDALPPLPDLIARLARARAGRSFAFHCVTHVELLFALAPCKRLRRIGVIGSNMLQWYLMRRAAITRQRYQWSPAWIFVAARRALPRR